MHKQSRIIAKQKNFLTGPAPGFGAPTQTMLTPAERQKAIAKNLANIISPVQLQRLRLDLKAWRRAIQEAENAWWPYRVRMQQMYIDNVLNGHVWSLMERRKDLTLIRKYKICDEKGVQSDVLTQALQAQPWFYAFQSYALDALFYGYSLISLGDIVDDKMQDVSLVPRWFVSPDRYEVGSFIYSTWGPDFREEPYSPWHVYVSTQSDSGVSPCGYGLLYNIAQYEIILRNTLGFNADFVELFSQPYRVGKTSKTEEYERSEMESALQNMGNRGFAVIDPDETIEFVESKLSGTGWQGYSALMDYCQKNISKLILGHADAADSTAGKLGGQQGGSDDFGESGSPASDAMRDKQTKDGRFMEPVINAHLFPRLNKLPMDIKIPDGYRFEYTNDQEVEQLRSREDNSNLATAKIAQTMAQAGLQMDPVYFTERTGIKATSAPVPPPGGKEPAITNRVKNKLKNLYRHQ